MTGKTVIISNQPFFYKKAELFPGSAFVIGADTAARLINVCHLISLNQICTIYILKLVIHIRVHNVLELYLLLYACLDLILFLERLKMDFSDSVFAIDCF